MISGRPKSTGEIKKLVVGFNADARKSLAREIGSERLTVEDLAHTSQGFDGNALIGFRVEIVELDLRTRPAIRRPYPNVPGAFRA
jgi:hypothetical protein